ncbi:Mov34/MPN/PAD-1 family protein [Evansella clarkii]|uniref:Mov34/MPN/PAD-1 family protein n=1 Tax=Evansella clarkii TaxID=79879 RepID=UPI0009973F2E|nr:Mov34/MPN/PAD-1 family protein [Evansella clarkii]
MSYKIFIHYKVMDSFFNETKLFGLKETGGVLIGYRVGNEFVITDNTGPGPNAKHQLLHFERDVDYCNNKIEEIFEQSNGGLNYLGEWHTHPLGKPVPSPQDNKSMFEISETDSYQNDCPLLIIVRKKRNDISIGTFIYLNSKRKKLDYIIYEE